jgi:hypothetical protein
LDGRRMGIGEVIPRDARSNDRDNLSLSSHRLACLGHYVWVDSLVRWSGVGNLLF